MIRRFNFTQRRRIPRRNIQIATTASPHHQLQEVSWHLEDFGFPAEAAVYLEASSSGTPAVLRIPWGTVSTADLPAAELRSLEELPGENVFFDFKVVDETNERGKILGLARGVRPRGSGDDPDEAGSSALLPVNPVDLGDEVWSIDFNSPSGRPFLNVNNQIPGIMDLVRGDGQFFSLVYPEVIRRILLQILLIEDVQEPDPSGDWQGQWLAWACLWHPEGSTPPEGDSESAKAERFKWIEEVSAGFATGQGMKQVFEESHAGGSGS